MIFSLRPAGAVSGAALCAMLTIAQPRVGVAQAEGLPSEVQVRLLRPGGSPGPVTIVPTVVKSDEQWRKQLGTDAWRVLRARATERPFCGLLLDNKKEGVYFCAGCDLPLFSSSATFDSGTGWPSFFEPFARENVVEEIDRSHGMVRIEIHCARCGGHLGHVFKDGPPPTGLRYCLNSVSLVFRERSHLVDR